MKSVVSFIVATSMMSLSTVLSQEMGQFVDGPCTRFQISNHQPFFKKLFTGTWNVYASYDYPDIVGLDCLVAFYNLTPDGSVRNTERGKNLTTNQRSTFQSRFAFDRPGVGHYTYGEGSTSQSIDIPVIDYQQFYIEFGCTDVADGKSDCYIGIFTRHPFPNLVTVNRINEFLDAHQIDRSKLRFINHDKTKCIF